jgi:hypothetical protein
MITRFVRWLAMTSCMVACQFGAGTAPTQVASTPARSTAATPPVAPVPVAPPPPARFTFFPRAAAGGVPKTLEEARKNRRAYEELPPDARFLWALGDLPYLLGKGDRATISVEHSGDKWKVLAGGATIGELGDTPDFPEMQALLVSRAQTLGAAKQAGTTTTAPTEILLLDDALAKELIGVNGAWDATHLTVPIVTRAAHAAVSVAAEMHDRLGVGDSVGGRAWALLAMAEAFGAASDQDTVLLAHAFGYDRAADALAARLPAGNALRAYLQKDDAVLELRVHKAKVTPDVKFLWMQRLMSLRTPSDLADMAEAWHADTSQALAAVLASDESLEMAASFGLVSSILEIRDVRRLSDPDAKAPEPSELDGRVFRAFEEALAKIPDRGRVPFDAQQATDAARARFYTGLVRDLWVPLRYRHLVAETEERVRFYGPGTGRSTEAARWVRLIADDLHQEDAQHMQKTLAEGFPHLGFAAGFEKIWLSIGGDWATRPVVVDMVRYNGEIADARPTHLYSLYLASDYLLLDDGMKARLAERVLKLQPSLSVQSWHASWTGDEQSLEAMAADTGARPENRYEAIRLLFEAKKLPADTAAQQMKAVVAQTSALWQVQLYGGWLKQQERWNDIVELLTPLVSARDEDDSLQMAELRVGLASALRHKGRAGDAWRVIEPAVRSWKASVLEEAAYTLLAKGSKEEALKIAEDYRQRYCGDAGHDEGVGAAGYAGILWRADKPVDAAAAMKQPHILWQNWRDELSYQFAEAFNRTVSPEETAALDALIAVGPGEMTPFMEGLAKVHAPDLALQVAGRIPVGSVDRDIAVYLVLKKLKDESSATQWFKSRQTPNAQSITQPAYLAGADELMFLASDPPASLPAASTVWELRAASVVRRNIHAGDAYDAIAKHYSEAADPADTVRPYARVALGLDPESSLAPLDTTPQAVTRHAFFKGVMDEGAGHIEAAADDYLDAIEFRTSELRARAPEDSWSHDRLTQWKDSEKPFRLIATEGF